jgi:hypothetical protein
LGIIPNLLVAYTMLSYCCGNEVPAEPAGMPELLLWLLLEDMPLDHTD